MADKETRLIKIIKSYEDLKNSKIGELILIKGRTELIIAADPNSSPFNYHKDNIFTVSMEGGYVVQNQYTSNIINDKVPLNPFIKTSYKLNLDIPLERNLSAIAELGGLL